MSALARKFDAPPLLACDPNGPGPVSPTLVGIAKLASEGESIRVGHEVEYLTLPARSLLNKCSTPRMPFSWTINPKVDPNYWQKPAATAQPEGEQPK